ncbi:hypothetical protein S83_042393, partial [Arachis hypogaea]
MGLCLSLSPDYHFMVQTPKLLIYRDLQPILSMEASIKAGKIFSISFLWSFFQWFFTAGDDCGFSSFPTVGLQAYKN